MRKALLLLILAWCTGASPGWALIEGPEVPPRGMLAIPSGCNLAGAPCAMGDSSSSPLASAGSVQTGSALVRVEPEPASVFLLGAVLVTYVMRGLWGKRRHNTRTPCRTIAPLRTFDDYNRYKVRKKLGEKSWTVPAGAERIRQELARARGDVVYVGPGGPFRMSEPLASE